MNVEIQQLAMEYHDAGRVVEVFRDISFEVNSGTSLAVMGESGSGKTTLLQILGLLEHPTAGDVLYQGVSRKEFANQGKRLSSFRGKEIGFVFQFHYLLPEFDALENVSLPLRIQGIEPDTANDQAHQLLKRVGLAERITHRPSELSGGEQQRVAIARALVAQPGLVLADEPTGNLDERTGGAVQDLLLELQQEQGITLVVVTHSSDLAKSLDRVVELQQGKIVERV